MMTGPSVLMFLIAALQAPGANTRTLRVRTALEAVSSEDSPATTWHCVGGSSNRSCLFKNLYFARTPTGLPQFMMLVPKQSTATTDDVWVYRADKYEYPWRPAVQDFESEQAIRDHVGSKIVLQQEGLSVQFNPLFHHNIGHALFDGLYPAYMALVKLGLQDSPFRPVVGVSSDCFDGPAKGGPLEPGDLVEAYLPDSRYNRSLQPSQVEVLQVEEKPQSGNVPSGPMCTFEPGLDSSALELGSQPVGSGEMGQNACCEACDKTFGCTRAVLFANVCYLKGACQPDGMCDRPAQERVMCRFHEDRRPPARDIHVRTIGKDKGTELVQTKIPETWILGRVRRRCMSEGVYQTFGKSGQITRLFEMERDIRANPDIIYRFDQIAVGSGGVGNMIQDSSGAIGGSQAPVNAMARFRDRMLESHDLPVAKGAAQTSLLARDSNKPLDVIVVVNKRFYPTDMDALHTFIAKMNKQAKVRASLIDWKDVGAPDTKFRDHLRRVQQADVYVSSIGTALQYVPFLSDRKVYVALGSVWQRSEQLFPTFMEQQLAGGGTPYLRTLYADPGAALRLASAPAKIGEDGFRANVNASLLLGLLGQAESLVRKGFQIPVPVEDNLSAEGKLLVELCRQDPDSCRSMQEDRNGAAYDCGTVLWPECVVYEVGPWRNKCRLNRSLLRKLRKEHGLFSYGAPEL